MTPNIIDIRNYTIKTGRMYTEKELTSRDRVCVIGQTVADNLFPEGDPVGKTVRINKAPFRVVGVLNSKGQSSMGQDQDDVVFVPLTTAMQRLMGITYIRNITIQCENENTIEQVQSDVVTLLRNATRSVRAKTMTLVFGIWQKSSRPLRKRRGPSPCFWLSLRPSVFLSAASVL